MPKKGADYLLLEQKVNTMEQNFTSCIQRIENNLEKINVNLTDLFNHQSSRLPPSYAYILAAACSLLASLMTAAVSHLIQ